ncbi:hypothetical protein BJ741DRAFT_599803 [Chytriomyces cf. hyalinus JEL632]|nr:hypothetical protein BJ741DRAFT_599803 [Chytriomyces cf. hyalinus JEL632]
MLLQDSQAHNNLHCQIHAGPAVMFNVASLQTCLGLTLFRYLVIVHQVQLPRNFPALYISSAAVVSLIFAALPFMLSTQEVSYAFGSSQLYCVPNWTQHDSGSAAVIWMCFVAVTAPVMLLVYAYAAIFVVSSRVFGEYRKNFEVDTVGSEPDRTLSMPRARSGVRSSVVARPESLHEQKRAEVGVRQNELMKQSLIMVGAFLIGWTPYKFCEC